MHLKLSAADFVEDSDWLTRLQCPSGNFGQPVDCKLRQVAAVQEEVMIQESPQRLNITKSESTVDVIR